MNYYSHLTEEDYNTEVWKPIYGYEGLYEISNLGRVKSLGNGGGYNSKERILKPGKYKGGYLAVNLCKNGKIKAQYIHRLVASAFIQRTSLFDTDVNHINEFDKWDNRASSLEWADRAYNDNYGTRNQRIAKALSKPVIGVSVKDGTTITFLSLKETSMQGFTYQSVSACCRGELKSHKGYIWKYA